MKICYDSHRLITRSSRLVSGQQKSKETQTNPHNNQAKPTKSDQSVVRQVKHVCALTTWCIAQKPRLSQLLQQLIECHTSNTWCHVANSNRPCTMCYQSTANTLTSRLESMKVEQSCAPVWRALAYLIQIKQKWLTNLYPGIPTFISEWIQTERSSPFQVQ